MVGSTKVNAGQYRSVRTAPFFVGGFMRNSSSLFAHRPEITLLHHRNGAFRNHRSEPDCMVYLFFHLDSSRSRYVCTTGVTVLLVSRPYRIRLSGTMITGASSNHPESMSAQAAEHRLFRRRLAATADARDSVPPDANKQDRALLGKVENTSQKFRRRMRPARCLLSRLPHR